MWSSVESNRVKCLSWIVGNEEEEEERQVSFLLASLASSQSVWTYQVKCWFRPEASRSREKQSSNSISSNPMLDMKSIVLLLLLSDSYGTSSPSWYENVHRFNLFNPFPHFSCVSVSEKRIISFYDRLKFLLVCVSVCHHPPPARWQPKTIDN